MANNSLLVKSIAKYWQGSDYINRQKTGKSHTATAKKCDPTESLFIL